MAQLKDTVISGSLRATDSLLTTTLQTKILNAPAESNGTTYGPGSDGQVLISNGTSTYWGTTTGITQVGTITTGAWNATEIAVNKGGTGKTSWIPWGIIYASANTTLAQVTAGAAGNNGYLLESKGAATPDWIQATDSNVGSTIVKRDSNGDFTSRLISGVRFLASRTDHSANTGMVVENTDSTDPLKLGYVIGTESSGGIYDYTHNAWKVEIAPDGTTNFYGNATTATTLETARSLWGNSFNGSADISGHIKLAASKHLYMTYNSTEYEVLYTHNNGNVSLRACGKGLYIGYVNTTLIDFFSGKASMDSSGNITAPKFTGAVVGDVTGGCSGNAGSATKLKTAREIYVALGSTRNTNSKVTFDGSADKAIHVSGTLPIARGGTGKTSAADAWTALGGGASGKHADSYFVQRGGDTMTGKLTLLANQYGGPSGVHGLNCNNSDICGINGLFTADAAETTGEGLNFFRSASTWDSMTANSGTFYFMANHAFNANYSTTATANIRASKVYGAVWNDYAEYRECDLLSSGTCVQENDNGYLTISDKRLLAGASIISDTFGYAEGETEKAQTPIAVSGRVLAYTYLPREMYHAGMAVCSAPGGTVDIMTRDEIRDYPDAIIGIVSEIPDYETWGSGNIEVNGRIWIKVK